jgi:hypothetical protein
MGDTAMGATSHPSLARKRGVKSLLLALVRGARRNTSMRQLSSYAPPWSVQRFALRFGLAYELIREVRSLPRRIAEMHNTGLVEEGRGLTPLLVAPASLRDEMFQAHNWGRQSLQNRRPWATGFDVALFLEGLEAGLLFHDCKHKEELQISDSGNSSAYFGPHR